MQLPKIPIRLPGAGQAFQVALQTVRQALPGSGGPQGSGAPPKQAVRFANQSKFTKPLIYTNLSVSFWTVLYFLHNNLLVTDLENLLYISLNVSNPEMTRKCYHDISLFTHFALEFFAK